MKQIPLLQGKALLVELPDGAKFPRIETDQSVIPYGQDLTWDINGGDKSYGMDETEWVTLPAGNWRIIGMLSEVTEEQAAGLVDKLQLTSYDQNGLVHYVIFRDYNHPHMLFKLATEYKETALESLESAILAEGFTFQNNLRNPDDVCYFSRDIMIADVREYHEAQSRVLCRERCLLLGREDL